MKLPGFSLLELMVSTVLGAILLLTASAMFMTFMIGNASTNVRRQMSAEGTQMLGTLEYHIRNAEDAVVGSTDVTANQTCSELGTTGKYLTLTNLNGATVTTACFRDVTESVPTMRLLFHPGLPTLNPTCNASSANALNSEKVPIETTLNDSYQFTCTQAANGKKTIKIEFILTPNIDDSAINAPFSTTVQLRNS